MEIAALPTTATGRINWASLSLANIVEAHAEAKATGRSDITNRARRAARRRAAALWTRRQASTKQATTLRSLAIKAGVTGPGALDRFATRVILTAAAVEIVDAHRAVFLVEQALRSTDGAAEARSARNASHNARRDTKARRIAHQHNADIAAAAQRSAPATARQVDYIVDLLLDGKGDQGGMTSTSHLMHSRNHVNRSAIEALTQGEAGHIIDSLTSTY